MKETRGLKSGDVLHYKARGFKKIFAGFNRTKSALLLVHSGVYVVATLERGRIKIVPFINFLNETSFISSSPNWETNPIGEVFSIIGKSYKNSDQFVGEVLGSKDFESFRSGDVLKYCIKKGWLSE